MSTQDPCFDSNGNVLPAYGSCRPSDSTDIDLAYTCCAAGQTCLSNGLCMTDTGGLYNGGCTDKTYTSPVCPKSCLSGSVHFIASCPRCQTSTGSTFACGAYCCSGDGSLNCCDDTDNRLPLNTGISTANAAFVIPITPSATASTLMSTSSLASIPVSSFTTSFSSPASSIIPSTPPAKMPVHSGLDKQEIAAVVVVAVVVLLFSIFGIRYIAGMDPDFGLRRRWIERKERRRSTAGESSANGHDVPPEVSQDRSGAEVTNANRSIAFELEALKTGLEGLNSNTSQPVELSAGPGPHDGADDTDELISTPIAGRWAAWIRNVNGTSEPWKVAGKQWFNSTRKERLIAAVRGRTANQDSSLRAIENVRIIRAALTALAKLPYEDPMLGTLGKLLDEVYPFSEFPLLPPEDDDSSRGGVSLAMTEDPDAITPIHPGTPVILPPASRAGDTHGLDGNVDSAGTEHVPRGQLILRRARHIPSHVWAGVCEASSCLWDGLCACLREVFCTPKKSFHGRQGVLGYAPYTRT